MAISTRSTVYQKQMPSMMRFFSFSNIDTSNAALPSLIIRTNYKFEQFNICEKDVYNVLKSLDPSKATGSDGIALKCSKKQLHQLVFLYDTFCKALNDKKDIRIVFCDQSKAFDRFMPAGLLFKLETHGVKVEALLLIILQT